MSGNLYPGLREAQHHPDGLNIRLTEIFGFNNSIQNINISKRFKIMNPKSTKRSLEHIKL